VKTSSSEVLYAEGFSPTRE